MTPVCQYLTTTGHGYQKLELGLCIRCTKQSEIREDSDDVLPIYLTDWWSTDDRGTPN